MLRCHLNDRILSYDRFTGQMQYKLDAGGKPSTRLPPGGLSELRENEKHDYYHRVDLNQKLPLAVTILLYEENWIHVNENDYLHETSITIV